jgi:hypothetical protein
MSDIHPIFALLTPEEEKICEDLAVSIMSGDEISYDRLDTFQPESITKIKLATAVFAQMWLEVLERNNRA